MKYTTPEISWHARDPIYSVDLQHSTGDVRRLATCGTDRLIRIWSVNITNVDNKQKGVVPVQFLSSLSRHSRTVNVVRFSPNGLWLASGADDSTVIVWKLSDLPPTNSFLQEDEEENRETWNTFKVLRSHLEDVYDLCWSADSKMLLSGSVDNTAILWDVTKGNKLWMFTEHKSFVQGVAIDPLNRFLATASDDRSLRIYALETRKLLHDVKKLPTAKTKTSRMFHSADSMKSFFRRLAFSPDGEILVVPAGCMENTQGKEAAAAAAATPAATTSATATPVATTSAAATATTSAAAKNVNATYVFSRVNLAKPVMALAGPSKPTLAVRFCPLLFTLRRKSGTATDATVKAGDDYHGTLFKLPYRMIFAVAAENEVFLYDTEQRYPCAYFANLHYHTLSDITWSHDGRLLIISSTDGFCTLVTFDVGELGTVYSPEEHAEPQTTATSGTQNVTKDEKLTTVAEVMEVQEEQDINQNTKMAVDDVIPDDLNLVLETSNEATCQATEVPAVKSKKVSTNFTVPVVRVPTVPVAPAPTLPVVPVSTPVVAPVPTVPVVPAPTLPVVPVSTPVVAPVPISPTVAPAATLPVVPVSTHVVAPVPTAPVAPSPTPPTIPLLTPAVAPVQTPPKPTPPIHNLLTYFKRVESSKTRRIETTTCEARSGSVGLASGPDKLSETGAASKTNGGRTNKILAAKTQGVGIEKHADVGRVAVPTQLPQSGTNWRTNLKATDSQVTEIIIIDSPVKTFPGPSQPLQASSELQMSAKHPDVQANVAAAELHTNDANLRTDFKLTDTDVAKPVSGETPVNHFPVQSPQSASELRPSAAEPLDVQANKTVAVEKTADDAERPAKRPRRVLLTTISAE